MDKDLENRARLARSSSGSPSAFADLRRACERAGQALPGISEQVAWLRGNAPKLETATFLIDLLESPRPQERSLAKRVLPKLLDVEDRELAPELQGLLVQGQDRGESFCVALGNALASIDPEVFFEIIDQLDEHPRWEGVLGVAQIDPDHPRLLHTVSLLISEFLDIYGDELEEPILNLSELFETLGKRRMKALVATLEEGLNTDALVRSILGKLNAEETIRWVEQDAKYCDCCGHPITGGPIPDYWEIYFGGD